MKSNGRKISPLRRQRRDHNSKLCRFAGCLHCHALTKLQWLSSSSNTSGFAQFPLVAETFPKPSHSIADFTDNRRLCRHWWAIVFQAKNRLSPISGAR